MSGAGIYRPRNRWVGFTVNAIEWYDIALFGALASVLARPLGRFWSACGRIRTDVVGPSWPW